MTNTVVAATTDLRLVVGFDQDCSERESLEHAVLAITTRSSERVREVATHIVEGRYVATVLFSESRAADEFVEAGFAVAGTAERTEPVPVELARMRQRCGTRSAPADASSASTAMSTRSSTRSPVTHFSNEPASSTCWASTRPSRPAAPS